MTHTALLGAGLAALILAAPAAAQAPARPAAPPAAQRSEPALIALPVSTPPAPAIRPNAANNRASLARGAAAAATPATVLPMSGASARPGAPAAVAAPDNTPAAAPQPLAPPAVLPLSAIQAATPRPAASVRTPVPAGATGRCKDGTYLTGAATDAACAAQGGLAVAFPAPRQVPARPARQ
jgi:hypothetical protein